MELILRNARLADAAEDSPLVDVGVENGIIAVIAPALAAEGEEVDARGRFVSPGLVETHIHLDKSRILDRCTPSPNRGTDHMERVSDVKPSFSVEDVYARAQETIEHSLVHGTMHMRTHVELDGNVGLNGFEALQYLSKDYAWALDLELCVFAQEGLSNAPDTDANLVAALKQGATVIGGAPAYDPDHDAQIRRVFDLAREYDVDVDLHLDVGHTTHDMDIYLVCELTEKFGWGGRVAIGHGTKYASLPPAELEALGKTLSDAGVAVTVLPATDLFVTGRHQDHSVIRGVADANALVACGVNCSLSTNNVLNPFTPFGDSSLVRIANMYAHVAQRGMTDELEECFEMLSRRSARLIGREDYGIAVGKPADFVVWNAVSPSDTVATVAQPIMGYKRGRRIFTRPMPELHRP